MSKRPTQIDFELTRATLDRILTVAKESPDFGVIAGLAGFSLRHLYQCFNAGLMPGADPLCAELAAGLMHARGQLAGLALKASKAPLKKRKKTKKKSQRIATKEEAKAGILNLNEEEEILEVDAKHALEMYREFKIDLLPVEGQIPSLEDKQLTEEEFAKQLTPQQRNALLRALTQAAQLPQEHPAARGEQPAPEREVQQSGGESEQDDDDLDA